MLAVHSPYIHGRFPFAGGVGSVHDAVLCQDFGHPVADDAVSEYVEPGSHVLAGFHVGHDYRSGLFPVDHDGEATYDGVAQVLPVSDACRGVYGFMQIFSLLVYQAVGGEREGRLPVLHESQLLL